MGYSARVLLPLAVCVSCSGPDPITRAPLPAVEEVYPPAAVLIPGVVGTTSVRLADGQWYPPSHKLGFTCSSSDSTVASVASDGCYLTGKGAGAAVVHLERQSFTASIPVTVTDHARVRAQTDGDLLYWVALSGPREGYATVWGTNGPRGAITTLYHFAFATGEFRSLMTSNAPAGAVSVGSVSGVVYAAGYGGGVVRLNPLTNLPIDTIPGPTGSALSALLGPEDSTLFVGGVAFIYMVDTRSRAVRSLPVNGTARYLALTPTGDRLYATVWGTDPQSGVELSRILEIDVRGDSVVRTVDIGQSGNAFAKIQGIAVSKTGDRLFVALESRDFFKTNTLYVCGLGADHTCRSRSVPASLFDLVLSNDGTLLYASSVSPALHVFDPETLRPLRAISVSPNSLLMAVRPGVDGVAVAVSGYIEFLP